MGVNMHVHIIGKQPDGQGVCNAASGVCTGINFKANDYKPLINATKMGHLSVTEHASYSFIIDGISSVTLAQLTRHRFFSLSVRSERYCGVSGKYVIPKFDYLQTENREKVKTIYTSMTDLFEGAKERLKELGVKDEDIRYLAPKASTYYLVATANARELLHFFSLRCCTRAQWEIRELANKMLNEVKLADPILFATAGAYCKQYGYCPEGAKSCGKFPTIGALLNSYKNDFTARDEGE